MRRLFLFCFLLFSIPAFAQKPRLINGYVTFQYTRTLEDLTIGNNPWGIGSGLQVYLNVNPWFRPTVEMTGDVYLEDDKTLRIGPNGEAMPEVMTISKILAGPSFQLGTYANAGFVAGAAFTNRDVLFTIKPSLSVFLNRKQSIFFKGSYIKVYNRGDIIKEDFISWSVGMGLKVF